MKKEVSKPIIIGIVAVAIAVLAFVFFRAAAGPPEFEAPDTGKIIPTYVWEGMDPAMRKQMEDQGYKPGDVDPSKAQPQNVQAPQKP